MPNSLNFTRGAGQDKTLRTVTQDAQQLAYAATISVTPVENVNFFQVAQLTGALTINAVVTNLFIGDTVRFMFSADATNRVVTFGTGFVSAGTVTVTASKFASVEFVFNGTSLQEVSRAVTV
jgi:hypothetical protein